MTARVVVVGADREADGLAHAEEFGIPAPGVTDASGATVKAAATGVGLPSISNHILLMWRSGV